MPRSRQQKRSSRRRKGRRRQRRSSWAARGRRLFDILEVDGLVFVDEWKGARSNTPDSPVYFFGRLFLRSDAWKVGRLAEWLERAGAGDWHATDRRGLWWSDCYSGIVAALDSCDSHVFECLNSIQDLNNPELLAKWDALLARHHQLGVYEGLNPYGVGLLRYMAHLRGRLAELRMMEHSIAASSVAIVCDRMDWLNGSRLTGLAHPDRLAELPQLPNDDLKTASPTVRAFALTGEESEVELAVRPFVDLADAEAWAFGRTQSTKMPGGQTLRQRLLDWQRGVVPADSRVLNSSHEIRNLYANLPRAAGEHVSRFWIGKRRSGRVHVIGADLGRS